MGLHLLLQTSTQPSGSLAWIAVAGVFISAASLATAITSAWVANKQAKTAAAQKAIAEQQLAISNNQRDIAKGNLKIAADKLRLELWPARKKIYDRTWQFLDLATGKRIDVNEYTDFRRETADAQFLFDKPIADFLDKFGVDALEHRMAEEYLKHAHSQLTNGMTPEYEALIKRDNAAANAIANYYVTIAKTFRSYFYFENVTTDLVDLVIRGTKNPTDA